MDDAPAPDGLPPDLRFLKGLVTVLTATLIVGFVVIVALLVIRLSPATETADAPVLPPLPESLALPEGHRATAFTQGPTWYAVVTDRDEILVYDRTSGALRQRVRIADR